MQRRQSTRLRNRVAKARAQRIANYLRALDEQNAGKPRRSLSLEVQHNNANGVDGAYRKVLTPENKEGSRRKHCGYQKLSRYRIPLH